MAIGANDVARAKTMICNHVDGSLVQMSQQIRAMGISNRPKG